MNVKTIDPPKFRYHPDPVASKVLIPSKGKCPCCGTAGGWTYVGPFYALEEVEGLCPWCIASGSAHARFDMEFGLAYALEPGADDRAKKELLTRTPSYFVAQEEPWPVHCGDFCAVLVRLEPELYDRYRNEIQSDLAIIKQRLEIERDELEEYLQMEASPLWAQLFKCLTCDVLRLSADFE